VTALRQGLTLRQELSVGRFSLPLNDPGPDASLPGPHGGRRTEVVGRPEVGHVYKIANYAQGSRREAHGRDSHRPHGVVMSSPDGLTNVAARGTQKHEYVPATDFWSDKVPTMGLDKDGFFSQRGRWLKSVTAQMLGDPHMADYLGPLPPEQFNDFCAWAER
jgi:hypothetical protein